MIRVLVVDDDKLVRKGLISAMPWNEFGMTIAGEANNGENALKFMEANEVDLLLTDLAMPVMSGIELMRIVREKYPHVKIVVLTLHQDFEYVQEALRLGAIDYIAKVQLEKEQFDEVLRRIVALLQRNEGNLRQSGATRGWTDTDVLYACYCLHPGADEAEPRAVVPEHAEEADAGIWYWTGEAPSASCDSCVVVRFRGLSGRDRKFAMQTIKSYRKNGLFYGYHPSVACMEADAGEILGKEKEEAGYPVERIKESWEGSDWIYEASAFERQLSELKAIAMPPVRLARIFYSLADEWNRLYARILPEPITIEDFFPNWHRFEQWLVAARDRIRQANGKPLFSAEIQNSIMKAIHLAKQHYSESISASEMAQRVNMSGSYFSQCFKQYAGRTYTDYVRDIRIERAKEYLRNTTRTIQWIAEQIGYHDEKYFSRLFREEVGALPSEYRQSNGMGEQSAKKG